MSRLVVLTILFVFAFSGLVEGVRECYKCHGEDCTLTDTTIQSPCPHIDNICYTVVDPNTCKVFEKGCGESPSQCDVYSKCEFCDTDRCNSEVNFTCDKPPCNK